MLPVLCKNWTYIVWKAWDHHVFMFRGPLIFGVTTTASLLEHLQPKHQNSEMFQFHNFFLSSDLGALWIGDCCCCCCCYCSCSTFLTLTSMNYLLYSALLFELWVIIMTMFMFYTDTTNFYYFHTSLVYFPNVKSMDTA